MNDADAVCVDIAAPDDGYTCLCSTGFESVTLLRHLSVLLPYVFSNVDTSSDLAYIY